MNLLLGIKKRVVLPAITLFIIFSIAQADTADVKPQESTLLLRQPAISEKHLAFVYAGDIWVADRDGGNPRQLTIHPAYEQFPKFSPDGQWIAFSADYNNNQDVYVVSVDGGRQKRLTWHPGQDIVNGWTPDGAKVVFTSHREVRNSRSDQLYHVPATGGFPEKQMEAVVYRGTWSPNGDRLAFQPYRQAYYNHHGWRQHRGGLSPYLDYRTGHTGG